MMWLCFLNKAEERVTGCLLVGASESGNGEGLIVDKVVPTEIYTAHNLKKNRDFLLGFPWEHPSFKMGLVFPSVTNCPVASSARAQDIRICANFSISFPEAAILGKYFIYDSYSQVIQDTQVGQDTEASQIPK